MLERARPWVAPAYLFLCLLLGGSAQGVWSNMLLQLLGLAIIAWAASARGEALAPAARQLLAIAAAGLAIVALQLVPVPPALWGSLGPRALLASDYTALGLRQQALPLSLAPYQSLDTLLRIIPALAVYCAMARLRAYRPVWMAVALLAGLTLGVLLGAMQVGSADPSTSPWYLYPSSSFGVGTGFFANANHMGTLLIVSLPFLAALLAAARRSNVQRYSGLVAWVGGTGLVVLAGIALNQSLAAYGLVLPVLVASALILVPARTRWRGWIFGAALALLAAAVVGIAARPVASTWLDRQSSNSVESRAEMFRTTAAAARDFMPFGSGLGTFREVYHLYEKPADVTPTYVVHAHNDYLELALELGLPGVLLILAFLLWWGAAVWRVWRSAEAGPYARAASIASAAVLAHSLVDFPLRTAAISACMAMFVALLTARGAAPAARDPSDLRPTRHFVIN